MKRPARAPCLRTYSSERETSGRRASAGSVARPCACAALLMLIAGACSELPEVGAEVCGNGVVEAGEDCDRYAPAGQACRPAGDPGQCRFSCDRAAGGSSCPAGWACGIDKICREPTGRFTLLPADTPSGARRIVTGDFDADGRKDVVAIGSSSELGLGVPRMLLSVGDGSFQTTKTPELPIGSPSVRDLSEDGLDDIVFSTPFGLGVLLGHPEHRLEPVAYPLSTFDRGQQGLLLAVRGYKPGPRAVGSLVLAGLSGQLALASTDAFSPMTLLPGTIDKLRHGFLAGQIARGPASPCEEVLLAAEGASSVLMVEPCDANGSWKDQAPPSVVLELPSGVTIGTGTHLTDLDDDGKLDLVVADSSGGTRIAFGCDQSSLCALPDSEPGKQPGKTSRLLFEEHASCLTGEPPDVGFPLAIGDLQGDGLPDVVVRSEIRMSRTWDIVPSDEVVVLRGCRAGRKMAGEWSLARIADLNGDAVPDVIAGSAVAPDLQLFVGTGSDWLNPSIIETGFSAGHLLLGDFDGDLIRDVAVGELRHDQSMNPAGMERLSIAFGRPQGVPLPAAEVAQFPAIMQLEAAPWDPWDAIDEIGVVASTEDPEIQSISVLIGQSTRQPFAPFGLRATVEEGGGVSRYLGFAIASAAGRFTDDDHPDVAALGVEQTCPSLDGCPARLWLLASTGKAQMHVHRPSDELSPEIRLFAAVPGTTSPSVLAFLLAGDADGDGSDEVLLLSPRKSGGTGLWMAVPDRDTGEWRDPEAPLELAGSWPAALDFDAAPMMADLDKDGRDDLVVVLADEQGRRTLRIAWNDGSGKFGLSSSEAVPTGGEEPVAFSVLQADQEPHPELVIGTTTTLWISHAGSTDSRRWSSSPVAPLSAVRALAGADVTGDGLDDVVAATESGIRVWSGEPALR